MRLNREAEWQRSAAIKANWQKSDLRYVLYSWKQYKRPQMLDFSCYDPLHAADE